MSQDDEWEGFERALESIVAWERLLNNSRWTSILSHMQDTRDQIAFDILSKVDPNVTG